MSRMTDAGAATGAPAAAAGTTATPPAATPAAGDPGAPLFQAADTKTGDASKTGDAAAQDGGQAGDAGKAGDPAKAGEPAKTGAPEKYETFKLPDGMALNEGLLNEFTGLAKELGLTQEQAQRLVDLQAKDVASYGTQLEQKWQAQIDGWKQAALADKEIGGALHAGVVNLANKTLLRFGTPELNKALESMGLQWHPEVIRVFARIGKTISEDTVTGAGRATGPTQEESLRKAYPSMFKE